MCSVLPLPMRAWNHPCVISCVCLGCAVFSASFFAKMEKPTCHFLRVDVHVFLFFLCDDGGTRMSLSCVLGMCMFGGLWGPIHLSDVLETPHWRMSFFGSPDVQYLSDNVHFGVWDVYSVSRSLSLSFSIQRNGLGNPHWRMLLCVFEMCTICLSLSLCVKARPVLNNVTFACFE